MSARIKILAFTSTCICASASMIGLAPSVWAGATDCSTTAEAYAEGSHPKKPSRKDEQKYGVATNKSAISCTSVSVHQSSDASVVSASAKGRVDKSGVMHAFANSTLKYREDGGGQGMYSSALTQISQDFEARSKVPEDWKKLLGLFPVDVSIHFSGQATYHSSDGFIRCEDLTYILGKVTIKRFFHTKIGQETFSFKQSACSPATGNNEIDETFGLLPGVSIDVSVEMEAYSGLYALLEPKPGGLGLKPYYLTATADLSHSAFVTIRAANPKLQRFIHFSDGISRAHAPYAYPDAVTVHQVKPYGKAGRLIGPLSVGIVNLRGKKMTAKANTRISLSAGKGVHFYARRGGRPIHSVILMRGRSAAKVYVRVTHHGNATLTAASKGLIPSHIIEHVS